MRSPRCRAGWTLIEVLVATFALAAVLALGIPWFLRSTSQAATRQVEGRFREDYLWARDRAVAAGGARRVILASQEPGSYAVREVEGSAEAVVRQTELPSGFSITSHHLEFSEAGALVPSGLVPAPDASGRVEVSLSGPAGPRRFTIDSVTGALAEGSP